MPVANFNFVTDRGGYAPLTITVDASPSSDPDDATETLRYFWTFGDNSPRVEGKILSHTFQTQGQYTVTLSVLDPKRGLSTKSRAAFAWRTTPPNPVLIANPRVGPASLTVDFDGSQSTPGASPIASYLFDYNDGTFESSLTPFKTHTFTQPGIYNVGLIVYDTDGNGNIGGQTIYVFDGKKPSAAIQVVSSDVITPARFELQGSGVSPNPLGTITDYKWTLPNGTVQTGASLVYTTSTNGNFNIQLQVKDSYGYWSDPATIDLSAASGTLPIAQITADKTRIALGQAVKLSGLNSYTSNGQANLVSYEWTLPNGNKIYGPEKTVTFSATGLKTVSLVVTDSKGYVSNPSTIQVQVDARQTPTAAISMTTSGTVVPVTAFLSGLQSTTPNPGALITGYEWKIEAPDSVPQINFSLFGAEVSALLVVPYTHTISLRVFDSAGAVSGWISRTFGPLLNTPPIAVVTPNQFIDTAPTTVTLSSIGSTDPDGHNIVNAHWIFSDGGEYWGLIAPYYISAPGNYTATVRVLDEYGAWSDPVTVPITLGTNLPPVALITAAPDANNKFNFTFDASTSFDLDGTITRYDWFFSDGFVSLGAGSAITHAFPSAGTWRVGVNVFDNKGAMTTIDISVDVASSQMPIADITVIPTSTDPSGLSFKFSGAGSTVQTENNPQFTWNFGDQTPQVTGIDVDKTFTEEGLYSVILTIRNQDGVSASKAISFYAYDHAPKILQAVLEAGSEHANSYFGQTAIQREVAEIPALIKFSAANSKASVDRVLSYTWDFGDGSPLAYGIETQHRYVKPGVFTARLTIKDQDGNEASDATAFGLSDVNCAFRESDSTCLILSGTNDLIIDEQQNSFSLEITGAEDLDPSLATEDSALELLLDNEKLIDLKGQFSISGRQVIVQSAAIQPYVYDGAEFTIQLNGRSTTQNDVWATLRKLRFSAGSINATLPSGIKLLQVAGADYLKTFANPGTSLSLSALPRGPYTFTATFPDENVVTKSVDVTSGLTTIDLTAPQITSLQTKTMMKAANLPESDEIQRLATRPWPSGDYVASLNQKASVSMKSAQLVSQQATSNQVTNIYTNACGQSTPLAVVQTSINQLDYSSTSWQDFLTNNPGGTIDPNAKAFKPLANISSGESSVHIRCQLQSPSIQDQFNQWYRSTSKQCCDPNDNYCNMIVDQTYSYLTKDYARDDQPVIYQIKFKDTATGNIVTRSSSFSFNSVAAAKGYRRSNMTSILGLPANDFVAGWNVPHEFDIPIPKGMSNIEYAVDIQSTYPNERYTHAYYCWTGKRIQPIVKVGLSTPIDDPVIIQPLISKLSQPAISMSSDPVNSSEMPIEHDSRLGEPRANMARLSTSGLFPVEIDPRSASNTYPTYSASNNPYEIDVKVEIEVTEYGFGKNGYIPIKHIAMTPTSNYIPADGIVQTRRIGVETLLTDVSCLPNLNKTYCSGRLRLSPQSLAIPSADIDSIRLETFTIQPFPTFLSSSGAVIDTGTQSEKTVQLNATKSNNLEVTATYNISPGDGKRRRCLDRYGGSTIAFAQRSLVLMVKDALNVMKDDGYAITCNDAGLPFGGKLLSSCTDITGFTRHNCKSTAYPHEGSGHRSGKAVDTRYFYKSAGLRDRFDKEDAKNKIAAATQLSNYIVELDALDRFCANKQIATPLEPPLADPDKKCQDAEGKRKFTGKECFMNREKIVAAGSEQQLATYWTWDSTNKSPLEKSLTPATACPDSAAFIYADSFNAIDDYTTYVLDMQSGLTRLNTLFEPNFKILFTFGNASQLTDGRSHLNWNKLSNFDGIFPIKKSPELDIKYHIYINGTSARSLNINQVNFENEPEHLDHLHLEAR